jgi:alpha 1,2-mannosyltransferase
MLTPTLPVTRIVMVAGNADTLQRVKWSVSHMRNQGATLPVQVYHFPSERPADDDPIRQDLYELAVELVEATGQAKDVGKTKSYHLKALAVVQCPWREVLYLDSDSIPLRDPEYMFDSPSYLRTRFWATPDYWKTSPNNPMWAILGIRCRNEWEMEAGQIFVDKKYHLDVFVSAVMA